MAAMAVVGILKKEENSEINEDEEILIFKMADIVVVGILKREENPEINEDEENFEEAGRAVNTVITHTR
jgi:hypothetical protein